MKYIGVLSAALQFLYHYSQQSQVAVVSRQSMVLRTAAASAMIHRQYKRGVIATLEVMLPPITFLFVLKFCLYIYIYLFF